MAYTKEILTLAVEIGDCMLRNGAEIYRVEDTVVHILSSYEVEEFDVYVLSNGIFAIHTCYVIDADLPAVKCLLLFCAYIHEDFFFWGISMLRHFHAPFD